MGQGKKDPIGNYTGRPISERLFGENVEGLSIPAGTTQDCSPNAKPSPAELVTLALASRRLLGLERHEDMVTKVEKRLPTSNGIRAQYTQPNKVVKRAEAGGQKGVRSGAAGLNLLEQAAADPAVNILIPCFQTGQTVVVLIFQVEVPAHSSLGEERGCLTPLAFLRVFLRQPNHESSIGPALDRSGQGNVPLGGLTKLSENLGSIGVQPPIIRIRSRQPVEVAQRRGPLRAGAQRCDSLPIPVAQRVVAAVSRCLPICRLRSIEVPCFRKEPS
jgi:hypothetical protein